MGSSPVFLAGGFAQFPCDGVLPSSDTPHLEGPEQTASQSISRVASLFFSKTGVLPESTTYDNPGKGSP